MLFSNLIAGCIMLTTAATLHAAASRHPERGAGGGSAAAARRSVRLRPVRRRHHRHRACSPCRCSRARGLCRRETFRWPIGLGLTLAQARGFLRRLTVATVLGVLIDLSGIDS